MSGEEQNQQEEIEALVRAIWHKDVVGTINDVLDADHFLGFRHFEAYSNPSIEDIGNSLNVIHTMLDVFLSHKGITDEVESVLLNCRQSVHLIRRVVSALQRKDEEDYKDAIKKLQCHVSHERRRPVEAGN